MGRSRQRRAIGRGGLASTTDKNRYYEFTAAPRLRGIATITSSVVARVVGARTPVASPAVANVVDDVRRRDRRRRRVLMFIRDRPRSSRRFLPAAAVAVARFYSPSSLSRRGPEARNRPRGRYRRYIQGVPRDSCAYSKSSG